MTATVSAPVPAEPLYSDRQIADLFGQMPVSFGYGVAAKAFAIGVAIELRDSYEAKLNEYQGVFLYYLDLAEKNERRIAALEAQLAEAPPEPEEKGFVGTVDWKGWKVDLYAGEEGEDE